MKALICLTVVYSFSVTAFSQLNIQSGGRVNIQSPAVITVTGNVSAMNSITGNGTVLMKGTALQQLNFNGFIIPNLNIQNAANVALLSNAQVIGIINLITGKIITGAFTMALGPSAFITNAGAGKFIETGTSGQLRKMLSANVTNFLLPVGNGANYTPLAFTSSGSYSAASVTVSARPGAHPSKPASVANYLTTYWSVARTGVTGSVNATATYTTPNVTGNEALIIAFYRTGTTWTKTGASINRTTHQVTVPVPASGADIYAMNDFAGSAATLASVESGLVNSLRLYPNPASKQSSISFGVSTPQIVNITLSDNRGRVIKTEKLSIKTARYEHLINLSGLAPGVYNVELRSEELNKSFKLVKLPG